MSTDPKPERARRTQLQETLDTLGAAAQPTERTEHGTGAPPPLPPTTPDVPAELAGLQGYEIVKELGRGGMGVVYLARNKLINRPEVLKVMNNVLVGQPEAVERFLQEIRSAGRLSHPNVAATFSAHQLDGLLVLAMEYVEGDDLAKVVRQRGPLTVANACYCVHQAATALQRGFELGLVHRDIKPGNILLARQGKRLVVKVIDFGLAKAKSEVTTDRDLTGTNQMMGTPGYSAPEQLRDARTADIRSDIYALGCTLYYLLAGESPFKGKSALAIALAQETRVVRPLRELRPEVPEGLARVVARMMAREPAERFGQPGEVAEALVPFIKGAKEAPEDSGEATRVGANPERPAVSQEAAPPEPPTPQIRVTTRPSGAGIGAKQRRPGRKAFPVAWWPYAVMIGGGSLALLLALLLVGPVVWRADGESSETVPVSRADSKGTESLPVSYTNGLGMEFVLVPKGESWLGGGGGKPGNEKVVIKDDFYLGKYEVTQAEWEKVTGNNPSQFRTAAAVSPEGQKGFPVDNVSWEDCQSFVKLLNAQAQEAGWVYRLPKRAEWEYACRGGPGDRSASNFDFYCGKPANRLQRDQANFLRQAGTCPVGSYPPNRLGLYDMHGNVWEWCDDPLGPNDPRAGLRLLRGGSWRGDAERCRASVQDNWHPPSRRDSNLGLRVARVPAGSAGE
jgi:serine/threonine protein kinase/formylglycine-generating enzyme required for sulfatase activity